jgi:tungstate transport system permease protein
MGSMGDIFRTAVVLVTSGDPEVYHAVWTSVSVAVWSILVASVIGVPLGIFIALSEFRLKRAVITLLNTLVALPTVVIGLVVYSIISRQGPLGGFGMLFAPIGIIIGQAILATPIVANYTLAAVNGSDTRIIPTALTLGASRWQSMSQLMCEVRFGIMAAVIVGFGRVISEVGIAMMLGGNIQGYTRTMTTAIALETSKGEFAFAMALGLVLMTVALAVNLVLNFVQQESHA